VMPSRTFGIGMASTTRTSLLACPLGWVFLSSEAGLIAGSKAS
jgi:hypothetical protein